jgi:hypothetical protein
MLVDYSHGWKMSEAEQVAKTYLKVRLLYFEILLEETVENVSDIPRAYTVHLYCPGIYYCY